MNTNTKTKTSEGNAPRWRYKQAIIWQGESYIAQASSTAAAETLTRQHNNELDGVTTQRDELQTSLDIALKHIGIVLKDRDALLATARMFVESYKGKIHMLGNGKAMQAYVQFEDIISEIAAIAKAEGSKQ